MLMVPVPDLSHVGQNYPCVCYKISDLKNKVAIQCVQLAPWQGYMLVCAPDLSQAGSHT